MHRFEEQAHQPQREAHDEEQHREEHQAGDVRDDPAADHLEGGEGKARQVPGQAARPRPLAEHEAEVHERARQQEHGARTEDPAAQRRPDPFGAQHFERLDADRMDARLQPVRQQPFQPSRRPE